MFWPSLVKHTHLPRPFYVRWYILLFSLTFLKFVKNFSCFSSFATEKSPEFHMNSLVADCIWMSLLHDVWCWFIQLLLWSVWWVGLVATEVCGRVFCVLKLKVVIILGRSYRAENKLKCTFAQCPTAVKKHFISCLRHANICLPVVEQVNAD